MLPAPSHNSEVETTGLGLGRTGQMELHFTSALMALDFMLQNLTKQPQNAG